NAMEEVQQAHNFDTILLPTTMNGMAIAPRIAIRLNTGLTADVTDVADGQLIRPAFDGKILAGIVNKEGVRPLMATIRTGAFEYNPRMTKNARIIEHVFNKYIESGLQLTEAREKPPSKDIRLSRVLIAGGGGIAKDFYKLEGLAKALNGQVAASRRLVDAGLARRKIQVGQSGKTVSPELYIAFGIHGALQHVEGLKNVKHLIVVNTDKYAPIRYMANIIVEGDAITFLELLIGRIMPLK
ncbi:MAG: electron transfer flavoprotein subunit alpha/FixB family protein, partial [Defluviitaleaceae bacterium]|nr:electron transfer flavoprotein subunit alpha/FixB family protein [Defluviitaleaceae bacterium]